MRYNEIYLKHEIMKIIQLLQFLS